jgi:hypothetical protein
MAVIRSADWYATLRIQSLTDSPKEYTVEIGD